MSEMNISKDSLSITPKPVSDREAKEPTTPPPAYKLDSMETAAAGPTHLAARPLSEAPKLEQPEVYDDSMLAYFKALSGATLAFKQQLTASDQMDQSLRRLRSLSSANQALLMQTLLTSVQRH